MNFEDVEIPKEIEETLYVCLCIDSKWAHDIGQITVSICDRSRKGYSDDTVYLLLATETVTIKIPRTVLDIKGELVSGLEARKEKELAEHHMKMKAFQDRIDNLLAIEYKPGEAA